MLSFPFTVDSQGQDSQNDKLISVSRTRNESNIMGKQPGDIKTKVSILWRREGFKLLSERGNRVFFFHHYLKVL